MRVTGAGICWRRGEAQVWFIVWSLLIHLFKILSSEIIVSKRFRREIDGAIVSIYNADYLFIQKLKATRWIIS
jgi:hypothetical protein